MFRELFKAIIREWHKENIWLLSMPWDHYQTKKAKGYGKILEDIKGRKWILQCGTWYQKLCCQHE